VRGQFAQPGGQGQIGRTCCFAGRGLLCHFLKLRGQGCAIRGAPGAQRCGNGILGLLRDSGDLLVAGLGWGGACQPFLRHGQRLPR
jgi:hypothetical protein